jgi:hypothetical protein
MVVSDSYIAITQCETKIYNTALMRVGRFGVGSQEKQTCSLSLR